MSTRTVRVTVRGTFTGLTGEQRATLLAEQADHDFMNTVYRPGGYLAYDIAARPFFTFRYAVEVAGEDEVANAGVQAELAAITWLDEHGYGWKDLKVQTVDMSEVPLGARGRKAQR